MAILLFHALTEIPDKNTNSEEHSEVQKPRKHTEIWKCFKLLYLSEFSHMLSFLNQREAGN